MRVNTSISTPVTALRPSQRDALFRRLLRADGYSPHTPDGIVRLRRLRGVWRFSQLVAKRKIPFELADIRHIAYAIEPVKCQQFRKVAGNGVAPDLLVETLTQLVQHRPTTVGLIDQWIFDFLYINPFLEGTPRVACILRGWLETQLT
jgi:hypothetical protein